ncbi:hypothetical protein EYF80_056841 [Liparis tanakae]|uniref:Uncharacterized protein n=1 Tax=Liparis tanakae TaxID=230148 RepID=A0A4Z2EVM1_9TELE|nr:hypothetical protein EYF80_056841 [Liparis tanakae]
MLVFVEGAERRVAQGVPRGARAVPAGSRALTAAGRTAVWTPSRRGAFLGFRSLGRAPRQNRVALEALFEHADRFSRGVEKNTDPPKPPQLNFSNLAIPTDTAVELHQEIAEA